MCTPLNWQPQLAQSQRAQYLRFGAAIRATGQWECLEEYNLNMYGHAGYHILLRATGLQQQNPDGEHHL